MEVKRSVTVTDVTHDDLVNLLSLECGGFDYWGYTKPDKETYMQVKEDMLKQEKWKEEELCYEDILADMLLNGHSITLVNDEEEEKYELTLDKVIKGIELNAELRPNDASLEDGDTITGDCIMQYAIFRDIVFC